MLWTRTTMQKSYDIIVVGAGPAGSMAAYHLASQGWDVILLEKERLPRRKPCAGGLSPKAYYQLPFNIEDLVHARVDKVLLRAGDRREFILSSKKAAIWMIRREEFDLRLVEEARSRGAQVQDRARLTAIVQEADHIRVAATSGDYCACLLIGADGAESTVAHLVGLVRSEGGFMLAVEAEAVVEEDTLKDTALLDFGLPGGYGWVFPKGDTYSLGVGTFQPKAFRHLAGYLDAFIQRSRLRIRALAPYRGHRIPTRVRPRLHAGRVLLAGDAAGVADAFFGEGISYALKSGELAACSAEAFLKGMADLGEYTRLVHRAIARDQWAWGMVAKVVYCFPALSLRLLHASRRLQALAAQVISGERSLSKVWPRPSPVFHDLVSQR